MPSRMALTDYTTPTSVSFRYSPLMSAMTCSAGQRSAGSECRDDETSLSGTIAGPQSSDPSGQHQDSAVLRRGLGERRRRSSARGKGRFHWIDLCLGHYWDTHAAKP